MKTYKVNDTLYYYAPFNVEIPQSNMVVVDCKTKKPICVINIPYNEIPHDRHFNLRVKNIVRKELKWKNTNTSSSKTT